MANNQIKVLLVEDDPADAELIQRTLRQSERTDFELTHVVRLGKAVGRLSEEGIDVILLDNFTTDQLAKAVALRAREGLADSIEFESSGGVTLATVAAIAATGVERISVGAITHSAPALPMKLERVQ